MPAVIKRKNKKSTLQIEDEFRTKADTLLKREGYTVWWVPRTRLRHAGAKKDIFGVFDGIAVKGHLQVYLQLTDYSNHASHRNKIVDWFGRSGAELPSAQLWSWHAGKAMFLVETWAYAQRDHRYWLPLNQEPLYA